MFYFLILIFFFCIDHSVIKKKEKEKWLLKLLFVTVRLVQFHSPASTNCHGDRNAVQVFFYSDWHRLNRAVIYLSYGS